VDVASICAAIRDWTLAQISGGATDLDQLVCDGKTLRGSIEVTATGGSAFIAQVTQHRAWRSPKAATQPAGATDTRS